MPDPRPSSPSARPTHPDLRELFLRYGSCMAYIAVEQDGDEGIGSAFHVGDGVFVTARHVIDGKAIKEMRVTNADLFYQSDLHPKNDNGSYTIAPDTPRICTRHDGFVDVIDEPWFHADPEVDVAAVRVSGIEPNAHFVPLGSHLDGLVEPGQFVLSEVLLMGYPPIPFTREPVLIAATGQINAVVDLHLGARQQPHFIISAMPRGGFSGGLAFSRWGFALGVITQSLLNQDAAPELGYFSTTSIEAVFECLVQHGALPEAQKAGWEGFWDATAVEVRTIDDSEDSPF